ncbi:MAG: hypothetical protein JNK58_12940 [Phycisphaerae bacterium]|nr:hypothetical protein [Phycisphaerae bacterium]
MRAGYLIAPLAGLALATSAANASVHTLTLTITNNTSTAWEEVILEIRPPRGVQYDPAQYALVQFMLEPERHNSTKNPVDIYVDQSDSKALHFDYTQYAPMSNDDGPVTFTFMINNPSGMDFRVGYRKILVPAPAGALTGLGAIGFLAMRRRRST